MKRAIAEDIAAVARIDAVQRILEVVCQSTGMGFSAVARVTDTHWVACAVLDNISFGLTPGGELKLETTICNEIRQHRAAVVIDHVALDAAFCKHPTPLMYGFQSYISMPINLADGEFFGTLCAIDPRPAKLNTPQNLSMFKLFAELIAMHLDGQRLIAKSEAALADAQATAQLREQFVAVLGHDLRNPLAAIRSGADLLRVLPPGEKAASIVNVIRRSAARMSGLIDNLLDFARGRLGGGLTIRRTVRTDLAVVLNHVVRELQTAWPERQIASEIDLPQPISCDSAYLGQLLSNLLANAIKHGEPSGPITVRASCADSEFRLTVINRGEPLAESICRRLYEPFTAAAIQPGGARQDGLGLGIYIVAEIARAHGGTLEVASEDGDVRFTFRMPLMAADEPAMLATN